MDPFKDSRLAVDNLPMGTTELVMKHPITQAEVKATVSLFVPPGQKKGARRAISEVVSSPGAKLFQWLTPSQGKWVNYVTDNRMFTIAADLSNSINVEGCNLLGHYDPETNPRGTRLKAGIQECVNAATVCGLVRSSPLHFTPKSYREHFRSLKQCPRIPRNTWECGALLGLMAPSRL